MQADTGVLSQHVFLLFCNHRFDRLTSGRLPSASSGVASNQTGRIVNSELASMVGG